MKNSKKLSHNERMLVFSGVFVVVIVATMLLLDYFVFNDAGGRSFSAGLFTSTVAVLFLSVLLITVVNLRATAKREKEIEKRLGISDTLISCIKILAEENDINKAIDDLLKQLNDYFDGDRAYIFEFDYVNNVTNNSYEYAAEGVTKEIDKLQNIPINVIDSWIRKFEETGTFYISSLHKDVDRDSDAYRILEMQQIQSLIAVPLIEKDVIIGFLGIDNPKINYDDLSLLSSATFFLLDSIDRRESHAMLQRLSFEDTLTSIYNRNKFIKMVEGIYKRTVSDIGVAYIDINGLKEVNDNQGHQAGDSLIKATAEGISNVFEDCSYRIGGDEFVVLLYPVDEKKFSSMVSSVKTQLNEKGISISVGMAWSPSCSDIEGHLSVADKLMYEDKMRFYNESKECLCI